METSTKIKWHFSILKQILSGFLFLLLPVTIIVIVLGKAVSIVKILIQPLKKILPAERLAGIGMLTLISIALILLICFLAGVLIENKMIRAFFQKLEDNVLIFIPGYSLLLHRAGDMISDKEDLRVVLMDEGDGWRPGLEVERQDDDYSVVFFPGPPAGRTGILKLVHKSKLRVLDLPVIELMKVIRKYGKGSAGWIKSGL